MSDSIQVKKQYRVAGYLAIAGALSMIFGAAFWGASGTDLWSALASNQMDSYLSQLHPVKGLLVVNTSFWIIGVLLLGTAGRLMAGFCHTKLGLAEMASTSISSAVPMAIVAFIIMLSLTFHQPSSDTAYVIGWIGARVDDLATTLIIGVSPLLISIAGRSGWVPGWLFVFGGTAGVAGLLAIISMLTGIVDLGFIIVPVGLGWMIAAGIVLIKKK